MVFGIFTIIQLQVAFIHENRVKTNRKKLHVYRIVLCIEYLWEVSFCWIKLKGFVNDRSITKWLDFSEISVLYITTGNSLLSLACFTLLMYMALEPIRLYSCIEHAAVVCRDQAYRYSGGGISMVECPWNWWSFKCQLFLKLIGLIL